MTKRQNFNVTPEQEAEIVWLQTALDAPTAKDTILRAIKVVSVLAKEARAGKRLCLQSSNGDIAQLVIPEFESTTSGDWMFLVSRPHAWRRQLYIKGRKVLASTVWGDMIVNDQTLAETAADWDLPLEAVHEVIRYCEANRDLLAMEAQEELNVMALAN